MLKVTHWSMVPTFCLIEQLCFSLDPRAEDFGDKEKNKISHQRRTKPMAGPMNAVGRQQRNSSLWRDEGLVSEPKFPRPAGLE